MRWEWPLERFSLALEMTAGAALGAGFETALESAIGTPSLSSTGRVVGATLGAALETGLETALESAIGTAL